MTVECILSLIDKMYDETVTLVCFYRNQNPLALAGGGCQFRLSY